MKYFTPLTKAQPSGNRGFRLLKSLSVLLLLLIASWANESSAAMTANVSATRTSGVAPLFVFFDATGTTHSSTSIAPWRDLLFAFDFDDPDGGSVWNYSGKSKNKAFGSTAAHVFTTPGTYQVRVTITDPTGATTTKAINITVQNPDTVFAGDLTVCVSSSGNFSGCPSGARQLKTSSSGPVLSEYTTSKRRILFRRGDTFSHSGTAQITNQDPGHVGAYPATGTRPVFNMSSALIRFGSGSSGNASWADDWRVTDLDLRGTPSSEGLLFSGTSSNILFQNLRVIGFHVGIKLNRFVLDKSKGHEMFNKIGVVDCDVSSPGGGKGSYNIFASAQEMAFLGNRIVGADAEPTFRIQFLDRGVIQHNYIAEQSSSKALLKFHSCKWTESIHPCGATYSEYVVISDNDFIGGGGGAWMVELGPQTASTPTDERLRRITVERNYFKAGTKVQIAINAQTSESVVRDNIFNMSDGRYWNGVEFGQRGGMPENVSGNQAYNNTCYASETGQSSIDCVGISGTAYSGSVAKNNILYAPGFSKPEVVSGGAQDSSGNVIAQSNPFVSAAPKVKSDFRLSEPISSSTSSKSFLGFDGAVRLDKTEVGAYSTGNVGTTPPPVMIPGAPVQHTP